MKNLAPVSDNLDIPRLQDITAAIAVNVDSLRPFAVPVITVRHIVPGTIDKTGTDNTQAVLAAFIASVPDGSVIEFPADGIYRIDSALVLHDRNNLIIEGNGCTIKYTSDTGSSEGYSVWQDLGGCSGIWIRNFVLTGSNTSPGVYSAAKQQQHGIVIRSAKWEVSGCTSSKTWGDFVLLETGAENVWIHDNTVTNAGRNGVSVCDGDNVLIENNTFGTIGWCAFDDEPWSAAQATTNVTFRNNTIDTWTTYFTAVGVGNVASDIDDIVVDGNTVTGDSIKSLFDAGGAIRMKRIVFTNNRGDVAVAGPVVKGSAIDGLTLTGNVQALSSGTFSSLFTCTNVTEDGIGFDTQAALDTKLTFAPTNLFTNTGFETVADGWAVNVDGTISRTTTSPIAGTGSLKYLAVSTDPSGMYSYDLGTLVVGHRYLYTLRAKSTFAGTGKLWLGIGTQFGNYVDCSTEQVLSLVFTATATAMYPFIRATAIAVNDYFLIDSVACYDLDIATVATVADLDAVHAFVEGGSGDVVGPASVTADGNLVLYNGTSGKSIKDGGPVTAAGLALLDDANAAAQLATLGAVPLAGGTMTGAFVAADHGTASTDQVVNVCYGTGDPPTASDTTEGTLFIKYTA